MATINLSEFTTGLNKWLERLAPLFLLLAVVWLCWSISRIIWLFVAPPSAPNLPPVARQASSNIQNNAPSTFTIFSTPAINKNPSQTSTPPANIAVKGVMTAEPMSNSSALIDINGTIKNYRVGKQLEGTQYKLVYVDWNQVIIEDAQQNKSIITFNESMELDQEFVGNKSANKSIKLLPNPSSNSTSSAQRNSNLLPNNASANLSHSPTAALKTTNGNNQSVIANKEKNAINNAVNQLKQDPSGYLKRMGVVASSQGYEITEAMPAELRNRIGLKSGDRVLSVNGQGIGSNPIADSELLSKVQKSGQAQIQVKRGEQVITMRQEVKP